MFTLKLLKEIQNTKYWEDATNAFKLSFAANTPEEHQLAYDAHKKLKDRLHKDAPDRIQLLHTMIDGAHDEHHRYMLKHAIKMNGPTHDAI